MSQEDAAKYRGRHEDQAPRQCFVAANQRQDPCGRQGLKQRQLEQLAPRAEEPFRQVKQMEAVGPGWRPHTLRNLWVNMRADGANHFNFAPWDGIWEQKHVAYPPVKLVKT